MNAASSVQVCAAANTGISAMLAALLQFDVFACFAMQIVFVIEARSKIIKCSCRVCYRSTTELQVALAADLSRTRMLTTRLHFHLFSIFFFSNRKECITYFP